MSEPRNTSRTLATDEVWPSLPLEDWQDTYVTLHMWTQVVGKIRLALAPPVNHSWHVTLYPTCRGLTTSPMAYGSRLLEIEFDFLEHRLHVRTSTGEHRSLPLAARSVAEFYRETLEALASLGITPRLWSMPVEVE